MSDLLDNLENFLKEEKWTRTTINNYTIKSFEDLDNQIEALRAEGLLTDALKLTDDYLKNNKNSIIALYLNSFINFKQGSIDDTNILSLIKIFSDNLKWNIVEYLCNKTLVFFEDKYVIRVLIDTCNNLNKKDLVFELMERLVKADIEEADMPARLAEMKEKEGDLDYAKAMYKKAMNRNIYRGNFTQVEELWKKLLTFDDLGYDYFLNLEKKITKAFNDDRALDLLKLLYNLYWEKKDYEVCLKVLKVILKKSPSDDYARSQIVDVYREKYKDHSLVEEYIKKSDLESSWRDVNEAIADFEKHISFDKGNFVYHREWGIGRIVDVNNGVFTIDFNSEKKGHKMSLAMAIDSLKNLPKNHIWILKLKNKDRLKKTLKEDPAWGLKMLINSFDNHATMKNFKEELVPDVFTASEWSSWWTTAKKILKTDARFGTLDEDNDVYELKDKPLSYEEKCYLSFKGLKDFSLRFDVILDFIENADTDSEYFPEMLKYFVDFISPNANVDEKTICSYLMLSDTLKRFPVLASSIELPATFEHYYKNIDDPIKTYGDISSNDFKKMYLNEIKHSISDWDDIFMKIFFLYPNKYIFDELTNYDKSYFERIFREVQITYKERKEAFYWVVTNALTDDKVDEYNIDMDKILFCMLHLVDITAKDIQNKKDVTRNKKINAQVKEYLFKNNKLLEYFNRADKDFAKRLYTIISDLHALDNDNATEVKVAILNKYPDIDTQSAKLKYSSDTARKSSILDKLITTESSYKKKQAELDHINKVLIPENAKDIGIAREKGDLRENSEYQYAKDEQKRLAALVKSLSEDLSKAIVKKASEVANDFVTFGTKVTLHDNVKNEDVVYTIMGPWESDVEKKILSYQTPLAQKFLDKVVGDSVDFVLNDTKHSYKVKKIEVAKF